MRTRKVEDHSGTRTVHVDQRKKTALVVLAMVGAVIAYIGMTTINALATILPINGMTTGEISDLYPSLFTPAGITFSIWGIIYTLLLCFVLIPPIWFATRKETVVPLSLYGMFIISCVWNSLWIVCWHYGWLALSVVVMVLLLVSLIFIYVRLSSLPLTFVQRCVIRLPFSIYLAWIVVATVANVASWLVAIEWTRFGLSEQWWMCAIVVVACVIMCTLVVRFRDGAIGLVGIWAFVGILIKHVSGFDRQYPVVIALVSVAVACLAVSVLWSIWKTIGFKRVRRQSYG
ncbi:MAG: tryptophan-rich sensory protein [Paenibacillaceae bacterium]|nr:tryptophan-rich sensory protein [Paenibacillaceae bacterium]